MADEKIKISELTSASQSEFTDGALLALDVEDQNSATGFSTKSGLLARLIAYIKTKLTAADIPYSSGVSVADKLDSLNGLFKVVDFNSELNTVNAGATWYCSTTDTGYTVPTGYSLAATLSVRTNNDNFYIRYFHPNSYVVVKNTATTQQSVSIGITVLFVKTEFIT